MQGLHVAAGSEHDCEGELEWVCDQEQWHDERYQIVEI